MHLVKIIIVVAVITFGLQCSSFGPLQKKRAFVLRARMFARISAVLFSKGRLGSNSKVT